MEINEYVRADETAPGQAVFWRPEADIFKMFI
jgi:hypothetical protein